MLKKSLCIFIAVLMLMGTFASCGEGASSDDTGVPESLATEMTTDVEDETRESLDIPDTRYDGEELCFLTRNEGDFGNREIYAEQQTSASDNISTAVFERNDRILQLYGITISEIRTPTSEHNSHLTNEVAAPTGDFKAVISNTSGSASFAANGYLWNLKSDEIEYMDFTKPWWDTNLAEGMSIDGRLYFATGDLLTTDNDATFVIMFNKQIAKDHRMPDLYALVENKRWGSNTFGTLANCLLPGANRAISSQSARFKTAIEKSIKELLEKMEEFD